MAPVPAHAVWVLLLVSGVVHGKMFSKPAGCPDNYVIYEPQEFIQETYVDSESQCLMACDQDDECQSYNYEAEEEVDTGICELANEAADKYGLQLETSPGFEHYIKTEEGTDDEEGCSEYPGPQKEIYAVGDRVDVVSRGDQSGFWVQDMYDENPERIYYSSGYNNINWLDEYETEAKFISNDRAQRHTLTGGNWEGVNNVVIRRRFWYRPYDQRHIHVLDLDSDTLVGRLTDTEALKGTSMAYNSGCQYNGGRESSTDLATDESGLWLIWGRTSDYCKFAITKIDDVAIKVVRTWRLDMVRTSNGNAFIAQGILYVIDGYNTRPAWMRYSYNLRNNSMQAFNSHYDSPVKVPNTHQYMHFAEYNPRTGELYTVENTRMGRYPLLFRDIPKEGYST